MNDLTTYAALRDEFNENIRPAVLEQYGEWDDVAMRTAWNDFTDSACKDGQLTDMEYHYCPSIDDGEDGEIHPDQWADDDVSMLEKMAEEIGLTMRCDWLPERGDGVMDDSRPMIHWRCRFSCGDYTMPVLFSQGIAHHPLYRQGTGMTLAILDDLKARRDGRGLRAPSVADVLHSLVMDTAGDLDDFSDWCMDYGFDDDSIKARAAFDACREHDRQLSHLLGQYREDIAERAAQL